MQILLYCLNRPSELKDDDEAFHSVQVGAVVPDVTVKGLQRRMKNW